VTQRVQVHLANAPVYNRCASSIIVTFITSKHVYDALAALATDRRLHYFGLLSICGKEHRVYYTALVDNPQRPVCMRDYVDGATRLLEYDLEATYKYISVKVTCKQYKYYTEGVSCE
jgi:hypothetical protein